jgi:hypothetical protein
MAPSGTTPQKAKSAKLKQEKGGKKGKTNGKDALKEQVLALGGDGDDLTLLNGVKDGELVQGEHATDVRLTSGSHIGGENAGTVVLMYICYI